MNQHIGKRNVAVWLDPARWEFSADVSTLFVRIPYVRDHLRGPLRKDLVAALRDAGLPEQIEILVDDSLPETLYLDTGQIEGLTYQPASQLLAYGNSSGVSISKPASQRNDFWDEEKHGPDPDVVRRARELYERIGDWSMMRGTAVRALISVERQRITSEELEQLIRERACDFNTALAELCGQRKCWPHIGYDKSYLRGTHHVHWPNCWNRARIPPEKLRPAKPR